MARSKVEVGKVLTSEEVANIFGVDPKTVVRWADANKIDCFRTLGGHRRFHMEEVQRVLNRAGKEFPR